MATSRAGTGTRRHASGPVLHSTAYKSVAGACAEFEEVARSCRKQGCLDDLLAASAPCNSWTKILAAFLAPALISRQAHVFDGSPRWLRRTRDLSEMIDSLALRVLSLVRDDSLLPYFTAACLNAAIQELAPSPLFRVVLDAKLAAGPKFVL